MKKIKSDHFVVKPEHKTSLKNHKTSIKSFYESEEESKDVLNDFQEAIGEYQERLYAQQQWCVLIVLQGMDTAGKDGLIEHVLKDVNPQGCSVSSFKKPSAPELAHDFLWRTHVPMARRGEIKVFNRSYYEDVIAPYVHPEFLEESGLPKKLLKSKDLLKDRCSDIVNFEKYLARQGVVVIKLFLNLSKTEQKDRLVARIDNEDKNWKFADADIAEREFWPKYQKAYDFCLSHTSHKDAPWYVIPSDDKLTSRLIASKIITERLEELSLEFPTVDAKRKKELKKYKAKLG